MKNGSVPKIWSKGIVLFANYFEFSEADIFHYPQVQSRCLIYCRSGCGTIVINNETFQVSPGDFFLTTWNHSISYRPDPEPPYILCCVHVIPVFPEQQEIFRLLHNRHIRLTQATSLSQCCNFQGAYLFLSVPPNRL